MKNKNTVYTDGIPIAIYAATFNPEDNFGMSYASAYAAPPYTIRDVNHELPLMSKYPAGGDVFILSKTASKTDIIKVIRKLSSEGAIQTTTFQKAVEMASKPLFLLAEDICLATFYEIEKQFVAIGASAKIIVTKFNDGTQLSDEELSILLSKDE